MHLDTFLYGAFVYLAAAVLAVPIAVRLGLGSVLGYLIAGIIIGPALLGFVGREGEEVLHFAEFGVVMMLFLIGLELQPRRLWTMRHGILGLGGLQVALSAVLIAAACLLIGLEWRVAIALSLALALSSTAIVMQSLSERGLTKSSVGRSVFSVLLFQDIAVIPILAVLPLLTVAVVVMGDNVHVTDTAIQAAPAWVQVLAVVGIFGGFIIAGRFLMNPLFRQIASTRAREIFVAAALLIVIGASLLMLIVGLSPALGAFLAGVILAESEYRHEIEIDLQPFKGLLLAVFFISVGAGINLPLVASKPLIILGSVTALIVIKLVVLLLLAYLFKMPRAKALVFSFALAQGGEFAFVLLSFSVDLKIITGEYASIALAVVALSMAAAPLLLIINERIISPALSPALETEDQADEITDAGGAVIMAGYGRFGMTVGRLLHACGHVPVVLDDDPVQIELLRKFGHKVFYGDASRLDLLEAAGAADAKVIIISVSGRDLVSGIARTVQEHFPHLTIYARAADRRHAYELLNMGVTNVYREVFATSVDLGRDCLIDLGVSSRRAERLAKTFKQHDDEQMREQAQHHGDEEKLISAAWHAQAEMERVLTLDADEEEAAAETKAS